jgi:hypothetical protein
MRFLIVAVPLALLAIAPQPEPKPNAIPPVVLNEPEPVPNIPDLGVVLGDPDWVKAVYPVRLVGRNNRGQETHMDGCGVGVTKGKLHTAKHLNYQLYNYRAEVKVGEEWKLGRWSEVADKDLAVIEVDFTLNFVPVREPKYMEHVTVYGVKTKSFAQGRYIGDFTPAIGNGKAPLDACEMPVEQGDSGGGVFGDDGYLLGTISGSVISSPLVVSLVPIVSGKPLAAPQPNQVSPPASQPVQGNCPGGVCYPQNYQGQQWNRRR